MKKLLLPVLFALAGTFGCKEAPDNTGKTEIVHDSLNNVFPTWQSVDIKVNDDGTRMNVIMGDITFYGAPPEAKAQKTGEFVKMVLRIYGPNNALEKGTLIVTKDIHNKGEQPKDGITIPMDFAAMKKSIGQK